VAKEGAADGASNTDCVGPTDLATMLLLVCPEAVFAAAPAGVRAATERLRALEVLPPLVRAEVGRLRAQIAALEDARRGTG
jgi:hypothetical protein